MNISAAWMSCFVAVLLPILSVLVLLYSDVQSLKHTKADNQCMMDLKVEVTQQMTKNTSAIEALNKTLKLLREDLHEQQERSK
jgi:F0F1-type ATP synthase membrane subunit a